MSHMMQPSPQIAPANQSLHVRDKARFARLGRPTSVWVVGAIHGQVDRLADIHDQIGLRFKPGERLVYTGNMLGGRKKDDSANASDVMDEIITFRRLLMALPHVMATDMAWLRGAQEEMWDKLLQLHFAPQPEQVLGWMAGQGIDGTLASYGQHLTDGLSAANEGVMSLGRWTNAVRAAIRRRPGHEAMLGELRCAAFTEDAGHGALLMVNAGVDVCRPLDRQSDSFWWAGGGFESITAPYRPFNRIIRGTAPAPSQKVVMGEYTASLDGGTANAGPLLAARFAPDGTLLDQISA